SLGDALRFVVFKREWFCRRYCAKSAGAGATIPSDHERRRALAPAFPSVWTLRALADGVQAQIGNERFGREKYRIRRQSHLDPGRLLRLVQCRINLRAGHRTKVTTLKPLQKLNRQPACSILQQCRVAHITSRTYSTTFGLSGFRRGANIGVVSPIFHWATANSNRIRHNFGYFR